MNTSLLPAGGLVRTARKSDDYVAEIAARRARSGGRPLTTEAKVARLRAVLSDAHNGIRRLGVGMIGPIQLKLRYEGIVRNVLLEDTVDPHVSPEYDVFDDLGQAYIMSGVDGEVRITPFEGKRVRADFFRIASQPVIRKTDLVMMRINMVEQVQDETKQAIMKQEDARLMLLLQAALTSYGSRPDHTITSNHVVTEISGAITPDTLYNAVSISDQHELPSARLLVSLADYRDFYKWDMNTTGWAFKERQVNGEKITTFGEFQIMKSPVVTPGEMWLLPDPQYLGVMPVLYSLDVEENHRLETFQRGWVFDEMISMLILNPRGIVKIQKS